MSSVGSQRVRQLAVHTLAVCAVALCLAACGDDDGRGGGVILASDFDQSCTYDSECMPVADGDQCDCPVCPTAAISINDREKFRNALEYVHCSSSTKCSSIGCGETYEGWCDRGTCQLRQQVVISATSYDQSCTDDADCIAVAEGEACAPCQCASAAINVSAKQQYDADTTAVACRMEPVMCDACEPRAATCFGGRCMVQ